jgi:lipopolysaccharide export system permease protein
MQRLGFYLLRLLVTAFVFASLAVTFVILFTQSFRLLSIVIDNSSTTWMFFYLMALSIPTFLPLILPLGLGVAVIFVYHKLAIDSELVVMRAAGISPMRQATPAIMLMSVVVIVCYVLTLWLTPAAHRNLVALEYQMRDNYSVFLARPGNFNDITDGLTFYARARGQNGALEGILMHDVRNPDIPITIMADNGQVVDDHGQPRLVVFNGRRQEMNIETGQLSQIAFDQYVLDLDALRSPAAARLPDAREQSIYELLNPSPEMLDHRTTREHLLAEFHQRLATPLLALSYTLIGLAAILAGEFNRRGMTRRILIAAVAIVALQAATMSINSLVAKYIWLSFMIYAIALVPALICVGLLNIERLRRFNLDAVQATEPVAP